MDAETKRRIDSARDALVGKVPDPKGQVEQITIALTYKFMDDMDLQAVELGGKRRFFAGEFDQYAWSKLMDPALGAQEMYTRYSAGIERMSDNPGAAPLFRTIFNNAFLPYNDPTTLQQFLRIINEFEYGNSETLGDAYEYLTSIMGSQGDAGQFRTPRHIIEFIVDIVDPQPDERILDPACGTGGFLIEAYKHILAANADANGVSKLSPNQHVKLADNLNGYDIDPGMVRIALLNMYLHGMADPHISEYDTLTSEDRWDDYADVIVANPPFMTPKGGIRPHDRFSVKSRRSEVLFVDYMAEHLTINERAGIVVPEGIIFQAQNAHKALRKMLVGDYLVAVVSLPGGVFNPYSGVKTSILILDKALARGSDNIGFFKVQNDGFDLGAQRRSIEQDDLPKVLDEVQEYLRRSQNGESTDEWMPTTGHVVPREKIAEDGEYNLSGERYRVRTVRASKWPMVRLGDVAEVRSGNPAPQGDQYFAEGEFPFIRTSDVGAVHISNDLTKSSDRVNKLAVDQLKLRISPSGTVLFPKSGASTYLNHRVLLGCPAYVSSHLACITPDESSVLSQFLFRMLCVIDSRSLTSDQDYPSLRLDQIADIQLPLPPLDVQRELVAEIEGYQQVIDGARMVVESWRPRLEVDPGWPEVELGEVADVVNGGTPKSTVPEYWDGGVHWITLADLPASNPITEIKDTVRTISEVGLRTSSATMVPADTVVVSSRATIGRIGITRIPLSTNQGFRSCVVKNGEMSAEFLALALTNLVPTMQDWASGSTYKEIIKSRFVNLPIPVPPKDEQERAVKAYKAEQAAIDANRELMVRMEGRVRAVMGRVWGGAP